MTITFYQLVFYHAITPLIHVIRSLSLPSSLALDILKQADLVINYADY